jgi:hypothetical protein
MLTQTYPRATNLELGHLRRLLHLHRLSILPVWYEHADNESIMYICMVVASAPFTPPQDFTPNSPPGLLEEVTDVLDLLGLR